MDVGDREAIPAVLSTYSAGEPANSLQAFARGYSHRAKELAAQTVSTFHSSFEFSDLARLGSQKWFKSELLLFCFHPARPAKHA